MLKAWAFYLKKGTKKGQTIGKKQDFNGFFWLLINSHKCLCINAFAGISLFSQNTNN
nr:MAG TPA: hypothetical protein [Caudoviricetes sp.]